MPGNNDIILYGAGKMSGVGMRRARNEGWNPVCFCDRDSKKWGTQKHGLPIISLNEAKEKYKECNIYLSKTTRMRIQIHHALIVP